LLSIFIKIRNSIFSYTNKSTKRITMKACRRDETLCFHRELNLKINLIEDLQARLQSTIHSIDRIVESRNDVSFKDSTSHLQFSFGLHFDQFNVFQSERCVALVQQFLVGSNDLLGLIQFVVHQLTDSFIERLITGINCFIH
jgi:hypothetical protein